MKDEANKWWTSLDSSVRKLPEKKLEKVLLEKWSKAGKKDSKSHKDLFSTNISILQVHGSIQKENIIVSIIPSCKHNCINVNLAKKLQVPAKHIENTQVDNEDVQIYKDLKISMDKYVLHSDFYASDMDVVDVVLGHPWMESIGTVNFNVQKKFMKLWYKKKKITLHDICIRNHAETEEEEAQISNDTDTSDDEPLMVDNQTQTSKQVPTKEPDTTPSPIMEELMKDITSVKASTYHHPHHPARQQPARWQRISNKDNNPWMTHREVRRSTHNTSTQKNHQNPLPSQASETSTRSSVHLSLGWLDAREWYQWNTLLSRSYYLCSSHVSGTKHV